MCSDQFCDLCDALLLPCEIERNPRYAQDLCDNCADEIFEANPSGHASFYEANNAAQRIVQQSLTNPNAAWALVAVGMAGLHMGDREGYYFPDGSAIVFTESRLPVEHRGYYVDCDQVNRRTEVMP